MSSKTRMPAKFAAIRDAAVASAHGDGAVPKDLHKLFDWLFWESGDVEFDCPYFSLDSLSLSDGELRDAIGLEPTEPVTDEQRLLYVREQVDRVWEAGEDLNFAHTFRIESADGRFTFLCGMSWMAGQGGPQTNCHGLYGSPKKYLQRLQRYGLSNDDSSTITLARVVRYWQRDA